MNTTRGFCKCGAPTSAEESQKQISTWFIYYIRDVPTGKGTELENHGCWGKCLIDMGKPARVVSVK